MSIFQPLKDYFSRKLDAWLDSPSDAGDPRKLVLQMIELEEELTKQIEKKKKLREKYPKMRFNEDDLIREIFKSVESKMRRIMDAQSAAKMKMVKRGIKDRLELARYAQIKETNVIKIFEDKTDSIIDIIMAQGRNDVDQMIVNARDKRTKKAANNALKARITAKQVEQVEKNTAAKENRAARVIQKGFRDRKARNRAATPGPLEKSNTRRGAGRTAVRSTKTQNMRVERARKMRAERKETPEMARTARAERKETPENINRKLREFRIATTERIKRFKDQKKEANKVNTLQREEAAVERGKKHATSLEEKKKEKREIMQTVKTRSIELALSNMPMNEGKNKLKASVIENHSLNNNKIKRLFGNTESFDSLIGRDIGVANRLKSDINLAATLPPGLKKSWGRGGGVEVEFGPKANAWWRGFGITARETKNKVAKKYKNVIERKKQLYQDRWKRLGNEFRQQNKSKTERRSVNNQAAGAGPRGGSSKPPSNIGTNAIGPDNVELTSTNNANNAQTKLIQNLRNYSASTTNNFLTKIQNSSTKEILPQQMRLELATKHKRKLEDRLRTRRNTVKIQTRFGQQKKKLQRYINQLNKGKQPAR